MTVSVGNDEESRKIEEIHAINKLKHAMYSYSQNAIAFAFNEVYNDRYTSENLRHLISTSKELIEHAEKLLELRGEQK